MKKKLTGTLDSWTVGDITEWTVKEASRIARKRNSKHNPDGWSPVSRLFISD